jgi:putative transposase
MQKTLRYKYRVYPTETQKVYLAQSFGCSRFVYNYGLNLIQNDYHNGIKTTTEDVESLLPYMKHHKNTEWLKDVSSVVLCQSIRHLKTAYDNWFNPAIPAKMPVYKKKTGVQSITLTKNAFRLVDGELLLAKDKVPLKVIWSRALPCDPSSITITKNTSNQYFLSCVVTLEVSQLPSLDTAIGIDLGIREFATCSDGSVIHNPRYLEKELGKLRRLQRKYSKKYEYAKTHGKVKSICGKDVVVQSGIMYSIQDSIRKTYLRIKNMRESFLMQLAYKLVHENQVIVMENLNVKGMVKNSRLARHISDVGWGMFRRFVAHQCNKLGRILIIIDRFFPSSKLCHKCNYKFSNLKSQEYWTCPNCGEQHNRDFNASINIRDEGLLMLRNQPMLYMGNQI